ncbi:MAG: SOS response-associated peptidase [Alphaproteobacteria bacterium]|nr:SOS response-associated peptidase [Alphaproteobacteria bacterium]
MCGRYLLLSPPEAMRRLFDVDATPNFPPRFNVAPTDSMPVVRLDASGRRELVLLRWGLVPGWAKDLSIGARTINARSESVADKPAFREAFPARRCLVPADGYYEWKAEGKQRHPFLIRRADRGLMVFAGLWERWVRPTANDRGSPRDIGPAGQVIDTFTVLTRPADPALRTLHDRMPLMLDREEFSTWLLPASGLAVVMALLAASPIGPFEVTAVSAAVNNVRNDDASCLEPATTIVAPAAPPLQGQLL